MIFLVYSHSWNLQYPWWLFLLFLEGRTWGFLWLLFVLPVCFPAPPKLPRRKLKPSLWSGPPQLCLMTWYHRANVWCGLPQLSSPKPLSLSRFPSIFFSISSVFFVFVFCFFQKKLSLLLTKTNFSTFVLHPPLELYSFNFLLLITFSFFFLLLTPSRRMYTYTQVSYTTQRNSLASGPYLSFSHYISWRHSSHFVASFFPALLFLLFFSVTNSAEVFKDWSLGFTDHIEPDSSNDIWSTSKGRNKCTHLKTLSH